MIIQRRRTTQVKVGSLKIGSEAPIAVQSMTNTPTCDISATLAQIHALTNAGSELVRITINDDKAAAAAIAICRTLKKEGLHVPVIGDFHFNGHRLLTSHPDLAAGLAKYRINPGNLGRGESHDIHFQQIIQVAIDHDKPVRIGVNSGSVDPALLESMMKDNAVRETPMSSRKILCETMVESALQSAAYAMRLGLPEDHIVLSAKASDLQDVVWIYQTLSQRCRFPLHMGLTEAGSARQGIVSSAAAMAILLQQGIGDTIRVSLTPEGPHDRTQEVLVCHDILQSLGLRFFHPRIISCPGCGRTSSNLFQNLTKSVKIYVHDRLADWQKYCPDIGKLRIAVMGCVVNGPGESRHADIGISLPGDNENPNRIPVYIRGELAQTICAPDIEQKFFRILEDFVRTEFSTNRKGEQHGRL